MFSFGKKSASFFLGTFLLALSAASASPALAETIAVSGNTLTKDGQPWAPLGFSMVAIVAPHGHEAGGGFAAARNLWGPQMIAQAKSLGANTLRFQVSQPGLDPQSPIYDPAYINEILADVQQTRQAGLNVIVSMQWEKPAGLEGQPMLPNETAQRAWSKLAPALAGDNGIMIELYNEPAGPVTENSWRRWQSGMQALVDQMRRAGNKNVLVIDGMRGSHLLAGAPPINDPLNNIAYAVHPYFNEAKAGGLTPADWDNNWGRFAESHAVFVSEWNEMSGRKACAPENGPAAAQLVNYLSQRHMGLIIWALDMPKTIFDSAGQPLTLNNYNCDGAAQAGVASLAINYFKSMNGSTATATPVAAPATGPTTVAPAQMRQ